MHGLWDDAVWRRIESIAVNCFRPEGSDHRPRTFCKLLYNDQNLFGIFRVEDQFVRCIHKGFQDDVWKDSCVELFIQPAGSAAYFNFEFNCGGVLLASYVTNPARTNGRLQGFVPLTTDDDRQIPRFASLAPAVEPEITDPVTWHLEFCLPFAVLENYIETLPNRPGQIWRANFYKCGNETSHPHWASWMPLAQRNFHDPTSFGSIEFCR